jgi:hypothetical protein
MATIDASLSLDVKLPGETARLESDIERPDDGPQGRRRDEDVLDEVALPRRLRHHMAGTFTPRCLGPATTGQAPHDIDTVGSDSSTVLTPAHLDGLHCSVNPTGCQEVLFTATAAGCRKRVKCSFTLMLWGS